MGAQLTYDLSTQISPGELPELRNQILLLLKHFAAGPKPIRTQLCVCLAILAIQMKEWDDVLPSVVQSLSDSPESHACILDFLRVLPEEVTEGRKITLSVRGPNNMPIDLARIVLNDTNVLAVRLPQRPDSLIIGHRKKISPPARSPCWETTRNRSSTCSSTMLSPQVSRTRLRARRVLPSWRLIRRPKPPLLEIPSLWNASRRG